MRFCVSIIDVILQRSIYPRQGCRDAHCLLEFPRDVVRRVLLFINWRSAMQVQIPILFFTIYDLGYDQYVILFGLSFYNFN